MKSDIKSEMIERHIITENQAKEYNELQLAVALINTIINIEEESLEDTMNVSLIINTISIETYADCLFNNNIISENIYETYKNKFKGQFVDIYDDWEYKPTNQTKILLNKRSYKESRAIILYAALIICSAAYRELVFNTYIESLTYINTHTEYDDIDEYNEIVANNSEWYILDNDVIKKYSDIYQSLPF